MEWDFRPARDLDLSFAKRLKSHRRERGLLGVAGNAAWLTGVRAYLTAFHRLRIAGQAHIPAEGPSVMVGNHTSHLDALSLTAALPWRLGTQAVALAAGNVFFKNTATSIFAATALNALPIWRKETTPEDLAFLRLRLQEDRMVFILFPEGTRSRTGEMGRFRPGLGAFVAGTAIPVVPCYLSGAHACWPPTRTLPRPGRLHLTIGESLVFDGVPNDRDGWKEVATQTEAAVRALQPPTPPAGTAPLAR
jgi:1-acyl-sn-glycerol-3-phosphate acyltransferase